MARRHPFAPARPRSIGPAVLTAVLVVALVALDLGLAPPGAAEEPPVHVPPVAAGVLDPFRPPDAPWGAGNRGIEYDTAEGTPVHATAEGTVVFAGSVAGHRHVTVLHADGVRTSYSFLTEIAVVVGQRVSQGQRLGVAGAGFHLGARRGDAYFDPATLFRPGPVQVHLVAFEVPPGPGSRGERSALSQLAGAVVDAGAWAVDRVAAGVGVAGDHVRAHGRELLRTFAHYAVPYPVRIAAGAVDALRDAHRVAMRPCTPEGAPVGPPAGRARALRIGGLGSTSEDAAIDELDLAALGYDADDVARFSYAGGATPSRGASFAGLPTSTYEGTDSQADLWESGAALADLVEGAATQDPTRPLDLFAHSQGGLVVQVAITELVARHGRAWVQRHVGEVVTLATPHDGADLATAALALQATALGDRALEVGQWLTGLDADAASPEQLAETSDLQRELADRWAEVADVVEVTSVAARGDVVVPVPRTEVAGAQHVVVSVDGLRAHDALPGSREAQREVALALADRPPTCRAFATALRDGLQGQATSLVEDTVGSLAWGWTATRGILAG